MLAVVARHLQRALPRLEDIAAVMMAVPGLNGYTFQTFIPCWDEGEPSAEARD